MEVLSERRGESLVLLGLFSEGFVLDFFPCSLA